MVSLGSSDRKALVIVIFHNKLFVTLIGKFDAFFSEG